MFSRIRSFFARRLPPVPRAEASVSVGQVFRATARLGEPTKAETQAVPADPFWGHLAGVVGVVLFFWLAWQLQTLLITGAIAIAFALIATPFVQAFERRGYSSGVGIGVFFVVFLGAITLALGLAVPMIVGEGALLASRAMQSIDAFRSSGGSAWLSSHLLVQIPQEVLDTAFNTLKNTIGSLASSIAPKIGSWLTSASGMLASTANSLVSIVLGMFLSVLIVTGRVSILSVCVNILPARIGNFCLHYAPTVSSTFGAWLRGQSILAISMGLLTWAWLWGLSFFDVGPKHGHAALALTMALAEFFPVIGTVIAFVPAIAMGLGTTWESALAITCLYFVLQQVEGWILQPYVIGHALRIPMLVLMVSLLVCASLGGLLGIILASPLAALTCQIYRDQYPSEA